MTFWTREVKFCFLRGPLRWLTAAKNEIVGWLLNFRIRMFVKSAILICGPQQARNQDFMWGGANEDKVEQTTEMYFLLSDPFI